MPSYLNFDSTKRLRDEVLKRTLDPVYGSSPSPKTFTSNQYSIQNLNDSPNINQPDVDANRKTDLENIQRVNIFKPNEYFIKESLIDLPRRANLTLYPYFTKTNDNLIGIMATNNYDGESELFKFAANHIRTNSQGPVLARIQQNLFTATTAKGRIFDALGGNTTTLTNILRGKEPLVEGNNKITVASSLLGKGIDFLQTVAGTQFPWSEIPGDYLTNPRNPVNTRPTNVNEGTRIWQDLTGTLGSIVGIRRRPLPTAKPSDLLIQYMGDSSKNRLFDLLSYSKYAPNYTTTARSQQSSRLFNFPNQIAQGIKNLLGVEAPDSTAYIGDDRSNDVKLTTSDLFSGRKVRSSYYLSLLFDPVATQLFHTDRSYNNQGKTSGNLTWISSNRKTGTLDETRIAGTLSTSYDFREDSILFLTQDMLNSKPNNGGEALSHIGHILDQTSKYFKDGDTLISRGSAVKYMDNSGRNIGIEYARVWTKDRPYLTLRDTAPYYKETIDTPYYKKTTKPYRRTNIRKFDGSVLSNTWNLNIAPMSNGNKSFVGSSNIFRSEQGKDPYGGEGFYAKKYMLSLENLAWKTSTLSGFTVSDLPYCERGNNGGRVMWFPPYDLKVSEQSSANWDKNSFLGRPEPIYTYQNTERTGQLSFKIVVDHPSVLNLLVREHFKLMNEEQVDDYINAFFAGAKDIDFYSLIRTYTTLEPDDVKLIQSYLNSGVDSEQIKKQRKTVTTEVLKNPEGTTTEKSNSESVNYEVKLFYPNNIPSSQLGQGQTDYTSANSYNNIADNIVNEKTSAINLLTQGLTDIINGTTKKDKQDRITIFNKDTVTLDAIPNITDKTDEIITKLDSDRLVLATTLEELKNNLENNSVKDDIIINIDSSASSPSDEKYNYKLSLRRTHSVIKYILEKIEKTNGIAKDKWKFDQLQENTINKINVEYSFKELGYEELKGILIFKTNNYGENAKTEVGDCSKIKYNNRNLLLYAPTAYGCRQSNVKLNYNKINNNDNAKKSNELPLTKLIINNEIEQENRKKPPIDVMKRVIMKTLSECYYFKQLEETSPIVFNSLKEKLKYFHPAFHSMTPEGLNSRLTFLQQCVRPGDTIPIKGISDDSDSNARNTSFGPPPICVLRVGDFYHSKVIVRDVNITFEDTTWDLNPEGIGVQPMIANVTLQLNFIGGQGLEKPVERLQNALSSNFYANTEMYDERSQSTNTLIGGVDSEKFTKEFLNSLQSDYNTQTTLKDSAGKTYQEGQYLGNFSGTTGLEYTTLIDDLFKHTNDYFESYEKMYNTIQSDYGTKLINFMVNKVYRGITQYQVYTGITSTPKEIELFGIHPENFDLGAIAKATNTSLSTYITKNNINILFNLDTLLTPNISNEVAEVLYNYTIPFINGKMDNITTMKTLSDYEVNRDKIISTLDKLNFITNSGYDVKIESGKSTKAVLSSLSGNTTSFYNEYQSCITYMEENVSKFYEKIDTSINFFSLELTDQNVKDIISNLLHDSKSTLVGRIKFEVEEMGQKITDPMMNLIEERLVDFLRKPKDVNFKFKKLPKRKNDNKISYTIGLQEITPTTDDIKNLFLTNSKVSKITDKLNYYKK